MDKEKIAKAIEVEREHHGEWADEQTLERIVMDNLRIDPMYYDEEKETEVEIKVGGEAEDGEDPFPIEK